MGHGHTAIPELEGEESLVVAAKQIMMALRSKKNLTGDTRKTLTELCSQLITITRVNENEVVRISGEIEGRLNVIQEKIIHWETDHSMIWDFGLDESIEYLNVVDEAQKLTKRLETLNMNSDIDKELLRRAHDFLQMAMKRLEEEFKYILFKNWKRCTEEYQSVCSIALVNASSDFCLDYTVERLLDRDIVSRNSEEFIIDLVQPDVISMLKRIANLMIISGCCDRCSQAYISVRRDALKECLYILDLEKLSVEDVVKLEWGSLDCKIKKWIGAMKFFVRTCLATEKWLSEQIFGEHGTPDLVCFSEVSKTSILQLLNFGEAISIDLHEPKKLFCILNVYEILADLLPDLESLYSVEAGSQVVIECQETLRRLVVAVRTSFLEFGNAIATSKLTNPLTSSGVDPLAKYVMDSIQALASYRETINTLLNDHVGEDLLSGSLGMSSAIEEENMSGGTCDFSPVASHVRSDASILEWLSTCSLMGPAMEEENISEGTCDFSPETFHARSVASILEWLSNGFPICPAVEEESISGGTCDFSPAALHFQAVAAILECKLHDKAKLCKDASLQHIFLMNNIHYMAEQIKNSELQHVFGDEWFRMRNWKFQQHVMNYERATWSSILSYLKDDHNFSNSASVSKTHLKERFRRFYLAFEEVYRTQTAWFIPNSQLREDLRILASVKVIQAYRTFVGRHTHHISDKHIKYSADDLQNYLMDLFDGSARSLDGKYRNFFSPR